MGVFRIYKDGELISEANNVVTTNGKDLIRKYLCGEIPQWAGAMEFGIDDGGKVAGAGRISFGVERAVINNTEFDESAGVLKVKAQVPSYIDMEIVEIGIWTALSYTGSDGQVDDNILQFTGIHDYSATPTFDSTYSRYFSQAVALQPPANDSAGITVINLSEDFSGYDTTDVFKLAYYQVDVATGETIECRLKTDASNYYWFSDTLVATPGYYVHSVAKSATTAVGTPSWSNITEIEFLTSQRGLTAPAWGVHLDALKVEDTNTYTDYGLVALANLSPSVTFNSGSFYEVEYEIAEADI